VLTSVTHGKRASAFGSGIRPNTIVQATPERKFDAWAQTSANLPRNVASFKSFAAISQLWRRWLGQRGKNGFIMVRNHVVRIASAIGLCVTAACLLMVVFGYLILLVSLRKLRAPWAGTDGSMFPDGTEDASH
jgi:hypothetical protein